jgi:hypothetical protein
MTTMTAGGTAPRPGAPGAETPLAAGNVPFTTVITGSVAEPKIPVATGNSWAHAGSEYPVTTVTIAAVGPKLPPYVGDSWHPTAASVLAVAPLAAVAAVSAISLMGTASAAPARPADASMAHTTMTSGGTAPRLGARGAETLLPLANTPFTTAIAGTVTIPKIPEYVGDLWAHASPEYPVNSATIAPPDLRLRPTWMVPGTRRRPRSPPGRRFGRLRGTEQPQATAMQGD